MPVTLVKTVVHNSTCQVHLSHASGMKSPCLSRGGQDGAGGNHWQEISNTNYNMYVIGVHTYWARSLTTLMVKWLSCLPSIRRYVTCECSKRQGFDSPSVYLTIVETSRLVIFWFFSQALQLSAER